MNVLFGALTKNIEDNFFRKEYVISTSKNNEIRIKSTNFISETILIFKRKKSLDVTEVG